MQGCSKADKVALIVAGLITLFIVGFALDWPIIGRLRVHPPPQYSAEDQSGTASQGADTSAAKAMWPWPESNAPPVLTGTEKWGRPPRRAHKARRPPDALRKRFLASPAPLRDPALMRRVVAGGDNAMLYLARGVNARQTAHLDALAALAAYVHREANHGAVFDSCELLYRVMGSSATPEMTPQVLRWMGDASQNEMRAYQLGLLACCGGPQAKLALDALYDAGLAKRHTPAPYTLSKTDLYQYNQGDYAQRSGYWAEAKGPGKTEYVIFPAAGLTTYRDIYFAADNNAAGKWDEVLPTGLMDFSFYFTHPGGAVGPGPSGVLTLEVQGAELCITHHNPILQPETYGSGTGQLTYLRFAGTDRITSTLSLKDLRRDADKDGLTDITERALFTSPNKPDTDGDGLDDYADPAPLADPAQMGKLERGIARALKRCIEHDKLNHPQDNPSLWPIVQPWHAEYIIIAGCGPIAFCTEAQEYNICLSTPALRQAWQDTLSEYAYNHIKVSYWRPGMTPAEELEANRYADHENQHGGYDIIKYWGICYDQVVVQQAYSQPTVALEVYFDFSGSGDMVQLVEVEGEYYPVSWKDTWIS